VWRTAGSWRGGGGVERATRVVGARLIVGWESFNAGLCASAMSASAD
jgi:hypothetical protein